MNTLQGDTTLTERKSLRIGMIGAGFIAQVAHLHSFRSIDNVRIVALSESHDALRDAVAREFEIEHTTGDYRQLLSRTDLDAVVVSVPRRAQSLVVADALASVPAVLSEKPMAMTLAEAERLASLADRSGAIWAVGYMKRHDAGVRNFAALLKDWTADDALGPILDVAMRDNCGVYGVAAPKHVRRESPRPFRLPEADIAPDFVPTEWRQDYEYTLNVACHDINLLRMLFGDALTAQSFCARRNGAQSAVLDAGRFSISLAVAPADLGRWDQRIDVTFARGRASLVLPSPLARQESAVIVLERGGRADEIKVQPADHRWAFEAQARAFVDAIRAGKQPENSGAQAIADIALIDSLWQQADLR